MWYIFSMSIITINDIFAYMCGFFLGSTPLIVLSPKKTVEGFIGGTYYEWTLSIITWFPNFSRNSYFNRFSGGLITILTGPLFANFLQNYSFLTSNLSNNQGNIYQGWSRIFLFLMQGIFKKVIILWISKSLSHSMISLYKKP